MKKKLNINALKVTSFVTDLEKQNMNTVKGGSRADCGITAPINCAGTNGGCTGVNCGSANPC